jgi:SAM-dependent methyltransferase
MPNWDALYHAGTPPWDTGRPARELVRVIQEGLIPRGRAFEVGCGTGADAIFLSRSGFEVTAVDSSPMAIERARIRLEDTNEPVRFVLADAFDFVRTERPFDLVYDAGFYHFIRQFELGQFLDLLWRATRPGSYYLALVGATGEEAEGGPPQVTEDEIHDELGRLFHVIHVRPMTFESFHYEPGYKGWSCLMQRPKLKR